MTYPGTAAAFLLCLFASVAYPQEKPVADLQRGANFIETAVYRKSLRRAS